MANGIPVYHLELNVGGQTTIPYAIWK